MQVTSCSWQQQKGHADATSDQDYIFQTSTLGLLTSAGLSSSKQRYIQAELTSESALP